MLQHSTICAIITPAGMGAVATLRLSGPDAIGIADKVFRSARAGKRLADQPAATLHVGSVVDARGNVIDEVVAALFRAPHSFTGEDSVEISCHGSVVIQRRLLQLLIEAGARMALPGEYSKRAFLNGKMDLSQAEAVADLIASQSEAARRVALSQLKGGFSHRLADLRHQLVEFATLLELELDFSEEDVEFADRSQLLALVDRILDVVGRMAGSFGLGNAIKNGIPTVIVGAPNVGKSTLLNLLTGDDRAIVSDIQGTTRDAIEELVTIGDMQFRLIDTAGIRSTTDTVEQMGIERTFRHIARAQMVVLLLDATRPQAEAEAQAAEALAHTDTARQQLVVVVNKDDAAATPWADEAWQKKLGANALCKISARDGNGTDALRDTLVRLAAGGSVPQPDDVIVTNARHYEALCRARQSLEAVRMGLTTGISAELVAIDLHDATDALAGITGEVSSQEVLNNIFKNFCIGK